MGLKVDCVDETEKLFGVIHIFYGSKIFFSYSW